MRQKILLIDNYDSFTYNLVQAFLMLGAEVDVHRNDVITVDAALRQSHTHLVISPGPGTPRDAGVSMQMIEAFAGRIPIFGVCLGHQSLVEVFGGKVVRASRLMHGKVSPVQHDGKGLFSGMPQGFQAGRYHSLIAEPSSIPEVLEVTARTAEGEIMGVRHRSLPIEGVQFHPESVLTPEGPRVDGQFPEDLAPGPAMQTPRQTLDHLLERRDLSEVEAGALLELLTTPRPRPRHGRCAALGTARQGSDGRRGARICRRHARARAQAGVSSGCRCHRYRGDGRRFLRQLESVDRCRAARGGLRPAGGEARQSFHHEPQRQRRFDRATGLRAAAR